jgi:inositol hexakisphosphate/diphosphoinositol-pentakisphosphate kinase
MVTKALMIFKYGGQLTDFGRKQSDLLGKHFRHKMYPADRLGMLSLHSSYAHDLKFYASDEGRVQMTAAVFARSFLELDEEEIVPILFALVWNDRRANLLLEHSSSDSDLMRTVKKQLAEILNTDTDFSEAHSALSDSAMVADIPVGLLRRLGLGRIGNPHQQLHRLRELVQNVCRELREKIHRASVEGGYTPLNRIYKLWSKILAALYDETTDKFDVSKVPDILDCSRHDMLHHKASGINFRTVFDFVRGIANWVVPQEYGITDAEKSQVSLEICRPLLQKLVSDLRQMRERKQLQTVTRFYFTSESHMQTLMHLLETGLRVPPTTFREENYIAHVVIKMYENMAVPVNDRRRFQVEVWHSPGANSTNVPDPPGDMHTFVLPLRPLVTDLSLDDVIASFNFASPATPARTPPAASSLLASSL